METNEPGELVDKMVNVMFGEQVTFDPVSTTANSVNVKFVELKKPDFSNSDLCDNCHGSGLFIVLGDLYEDHVDCPECNGTGYKIDKCKKCDGTGREMIECQNCSSGIITSEEICEKCNGYGTIDENDCSECHGTGLISIQNKCKKCDGTGFIDNGSCPTCYGNGTFHYRPNKKHPKGLPCPNCTPKDENGIYIKEEYRTIPKGKVPIIKSRSNDPYKVHYCPVCGGSGLKKSRFNLNKFNSKKSIGTTVLSNEQGQSIKIPEVVAQRK